MLGKWKETSSVIHLELLLYMDIHIITFTRVCVCACMREVERDVREVGRDGFKYPTRTAVIYGYIYYVYTHMCVCAYACVRV